MFFIGMGGEHLKTGTLQFFVLTFSSRHCRGDCQLSWSWWECHLVWKVHYNEVKRFF